MSPLPPTSVNPSSFADVVLVFAGIFLQGCTNESKALRSFLFGQQAHYPESDQLDLLDLEVFGFLCSCLRSIFALVLLIVVRKLVMATLSPMLPAAVRRHDEHRLFARDLLFHIQCRVCVGAVLCLLPAESVPPATTNFLVLVASTLSQPVVQRELQSIRRSVVAST